MLDFLNKRRVQHLVHFTRASNLPGIFEHGLLPRSELRRRGIQHHVNDAYRYDYLPEAICLSITFPNYKMFYGLRRDHPEVDWAVLRLRPDLLARKQAVFCTTNAAKRELAQATIASRQGIDALKRMFAEQEGAPTRATLRIPDNYATDPQAEVLVLDSIEPDYISDVIVDAQDRIKDLAGLHAIALANSANPRFLHGKSLFDGRSDYAHWKTISDG